ncbi:hypothetical protein O0L34_g12696 [Tuta absoluta]|nr:hypothetical protein O0L34_g12696 [Tuta absoluta]
MLRLLVLSCVLVAVLGNPALVRSRDEIEAYRSFLENSRKSSDGKYVLGRSVSSLGNPEENSGYFEGDIILDEWMIDQLVMQYATGGRNAYTWPDTHWPNNTVVYEIAEGEFGPLQTAAILEGIADIERHSCIKFRKRRPDEGIYTLVTGGAGGCFAHVGYWAARGVHTYNVARNTPGVGCFRHATIVHEWLHILGFFHMQSTHNRDDYVQIVEENLQPGTENNFEIYTPDMVSNLEIEYDYVSCMHYSAYAFSRNGEKTIIALREHEGEMGQRLYITDKDWLRLNRHYNCPGAWDDESEETEENTDAPEVATDAPEVATDAPEVATDAPEVATDAPEVATDAPEVATDAPEVATDAPEVATDVPEEVTGESVSNVIVVGRPASF